MNALQQQDQLAQATVQQALDKSSSQASSYGQSTTIKEGLADYKNADRLSSTDIDNLMTRLVMEEKNKQKPLPDKKSLYKWIGGLSLLIILLILIF